MLFLIRVHSICHCLKRNFLIGAICFLKHTPTSRDHGTTVVRWYVFSVYKKGTDKNSLFVDRIRINTWSWRLSPQWLIWLYIYIHILLQYSFSKFYIEIQCSARSSLTASDLLQTATCPTFTWNIEVDFTDAMVEMVCRVKTLKITLKKLMCYFGEFQKLLQ